MNKSSTFLRCIKSRTFRKCWINPAGRLLFTNHPRSRAAEYSGRCWINNSDKNEALVIFQENQKTN